MCIENIDQCGYKGHVLSPSLKMALHIIIYYNQRFWSFELKALTYKRKVYRLSSKLHASNLDKNSKTRYRPAAALHNAIKLLSHANLQMTHFMIKSQSRDK